MDFQYPQSVFRFCPKLRYFTDQNGLEGENMKMNFGYFHIQKIMSQTFRTEKVHEKNEVTCPVCM